MIKPLHVEWMPTVRLLEVSLRVPRGYVEVVFGWNRYSQNWGTYKWYTYYGLALGPVELRWRPRS